VDCRCVGIYTIVLMIGNYKRVFQLSVQRLSTRQPGDFSILIIKITTSCWIDEIILTLLAI